VKLTFFTQQAEFMDILHVLGMPGLEAEQVSEQLTQALHAEFMVKGLDTLVAEQKDQFRNQLVKNFHNSAALVENLFVLLGAGRFTELVQASSEQFLNRVFAEVMPEADRGSTLLAGLRAKLQPVRLEWP